MAYKHGVYVSEVPTSILPPVNVSAGLPVVFGTAPVNLTADPAANVNKPVLAYTYAEAVAAMGFINDFDYTLCEFMKSHFALFAVAPVVLINVLDPATHKASVTAEPATLADDKVTLVNSGVLKGSVVVKSDDGLTAYVAETDYTVTYNTAGMAIVNRLPDGTIPTATTALTIDYDHLDPSLVVAADIIGGIDAITGAATGLELVNEIFPRFRLIPGQILAPKFSTDSAVAAVMKAKASNINSHFKAISLSDVPTGTVDNYADVAAWKNNNNVVDPLQVVCWPKVKLGDDEYHLSTQLAGLICRTDADNSDIPYTSPSNKGLQMDSAVLAGGEEVWLGPDSAAYLNGEGVVTAFNFVGGWKAWGNRTAAYPANTDPKDSFLAIRRMFNWVGNTLTLTFWQRLDYPLNKRQVQTVVDSANIWLNGLVAQGYLLGARVEFLPEENPSTDLMDGIARFHVYLTPPSPNREIDFILEYDPSYLQSLFG
ncbi:MAG: phage tail sheath family protein [Methyloprofundus sp.]|nr:phage tail sheath family protein [Methyloprofundus sp.]